MSPLQSVLQRLTESYTQSQVVTVRSSLRTYESDGLEQYASIPGGVFLARSAEDVSHAIAMCVEREVPYVIRGSGTGLSGGALPDPDGLLIVVTQMRSIIEIDDINRCAVVEPGVINLQLTKRAAPHGYYFAPDPSSQTICTIGGNIAENSGGAHCLKYGFTTNHLTGLRFVTGQGDAVDIGGKYQEPVGYDLLGLIGGSEGTLGTILEATVKITRAPQDVVTILAGYETIEGAAGATSAIISSGIVPSAIEMMDALAIQAAEKAVACGYPDGAGAVLIVELDGHESEVAEEVSQVVAHLKANKAFGVRTATSDTDRANIWRGRKSAFAAVGRISPNYLVQDGVVPRSRLVAVLSEITRISGEYGMRVANVFHAGDGNLHPLVLFDAEEDGAPERAEELAGEILSLCVAEGGSITGEHGVGTDKIDYMHLMFNTDELDVMRSVRSVFDPANILNRGKHIPTPTMCGETEMGTVRAAGPGSQAKR
ncbi:FAD-linked oxidase C-terminal domain-containing protein [Ruania albidiflava]|uniref:FAD-linked oxidase C-terminal domain-containing protein n=1 Tax=Ruania albidiflava TaxID=366586 RepID=UPI0009FBC646|nr:FAD-linked oxidase C-terminal domain-containing protein [Ruania albidiflava]